MPNGVTVIQAPTSRGTLPVVRANGDEDASHFSHAWPSSSYAGA